MFGLTELIKKPQCMLRYHCELKKFKKIWGGGGEVFMAHMNSGVLL